MIRTTPVRRAALVAAALAALAVSCSTTPKPDAAAGGRATTPATAVPEATESAGPTAAPDGPDALPDDATRSPAPTQDPFAPSSDEKVRDAFATLQATLYDSCTTDCSSFLGRVHKELQELDMAMKADPKGPGHFPEPIARMAELNETLAGDASYPNLKEHQKELIGTRDFINTWMQDHPDDYR
ncbi:hypothetical protein [Streptomyces roseolus]|uniref:hypothetical protein n=1 Tax=Streptomyces roseolus TaxID=67358 RepID=UPI001674055E|nr:hypothetical protein [Streptomyces roseolus]GGR19008.1 hypothetical protein GCM10010282_09070 [Streptomyces roseolus]